MALFLCCVHKLYILLHLLLTGVIHSACTTPSFTHSSSLHQSSWASEFRISRSFICFQHVWFCFVRFLVIFCRRSSTPVYLLLFKMFAFPIEIVIYSAKKIINALILQSGTVPVLPNKYDLQEMGICKKKNLLSEEYHLHLRLLFSFYL